MISKLFSQFIFAIPQFRRSLYIGKIRICYQNCLPRTAAIPRQIELS
jgi:hypothetical protein